MNTLPSTYAPQNSKALHLVLWTLQIVLGAMFLMAGAMKATQPIAELATKLPWVTATPDALVRFIGVTEFLGGIGLILPSALRIQPKLTPLAALGLLVIMVLAALFHVSRGEYAALPINATLGLLSAFIAWGRFWKAPITAKS